MLLDMVSNMARGRCPDLKVKDAGGVFGRAWVQLQYFVREEVEGEAGVRTVLCGKEALRHSFHTLRQRRAAGGLCVTLQVMEKYQVFKYLLEEEEKKELAAMVTSCLAGLSATSEKGKEHSASSVLLPVLGKDDSRLKPSKSSEDMRRIMSFFG